MTINYNYGYCYSVKSVPSTSNQADGALTDNKSGQK